MTEDEDADRLAAALAASIAPRYLAAANDIAALLDEIEEDARRIWRLNHRRAECEWLLSAEMRARGITDLLSVRATRPLGRVVRLPSLDYAGDSPSRLIWPRPPEPIYFASYHSSG